jgi:hypothetical protein
VRRWRLLLVLVCLVGCTDATGSVSGGTPLLPAEEAGSGGVTWTSLYGDFFGPTGQASCTSQSVCHGAANQAGAEVSGFVCGPTKEACWQGMTQGIAADAGGFFCPIVCVGTCTQTGSACPSTPADQSLYQDIHKAEGGSGQLNNMPCGGNTQTCPASGASYTFTSDDLTRISTWIQQGAQDN